jgi:hypothetical protein
MCTNVSRPPPPPSHSVWQACTTRALNDDEEQAMSLKQSGLPLAVDPTQRQLVKLSSRSHFVVLARAESVNNDS